MKIVFLNDDYPPTGQSSVGALVNVLQEQMTAQGHLVHVITSHREKANPNIIREGNVISLPISFRTSLRHYNVVFNEKMAQQIAQVLKELEPDVVHAHNVHQFLSYLSLKEAKKTGAKVFITLHDVMSFAYARLGTPRFLKSKGKKCRLKVGDHIANVGLQYNPFRNLIIRRCLKSADKIIAVSKALESALNQNGIKNTTVIHHGVNTLAWAAEPEAVTKWKKDNGFEDRKIILFGGRLSRDKGAIPLLKALQKIKETVPNVLLMVLGNERKWNGLVAEANLNEDLSKYYHCTGWIDRSELPVIYNACDVATTPSLCLDTFNLMNLEAMACSKPVVGTIYGGTPEVVVDGETGFICNPLDISAYSKALETLLTDEALVTKMGQEGKKRALEKFSVKNFVNNYLNLYQG